ncbi:MAG: hypothetical protein MJ001_05435 [Paludibacteraceae bacterium]|nr:hypothetical protein [Paludibacteraceae bacterium]
MKKRFDTTYWGAFLGLLLPFAFGLLFLDSIGIGLNVDSVRSFINTPSLLIRFATVIIFPDMGAVFVLNSLEMWKACRGVFGAIGIYTIIGIIAFMAISR